MQPEALLPEIALLAGALSSLLAGSFLPRARQWVARVVALVALGAAAALAAVDLTDPAATVFEGTYAVDTATGAARIIAALATAVVIGLGADELAGHHRESETYALLLLASAGTVAVAGANDLLVLAAGFLLASIPLYALIGLGRTPAAAEAALKTYLLGALLGITLLLGIAILYGVSATTSYGGLATRLPEAPSAAVAAGAVAVIGGLMFKAGGVPGHFWVPDAAQAGTATAAAFATTVPKVGAVVAVYRLADVLPDTVEWALLVAVLAVVSMTVANLAAFAQQDPRRLLGWSTVAQVGFLLVPVAVAGRSDLALPSLLLYLAGYAVTNLAAFAVTAALPEHRRLADYRGLAAARPRLAAALLLALLGLVGTPPAAVFAGKLTTASAAWDGGAGWLAVAVVANTLLSLFYYLRWLAPAYRPATQPVTAGSTGPPGPAGTTDPPGTASFTVRPAAAATAIAAGAVSLLLGLAAGGVWAVFDGPLAR